MKTNYEYFLEEYNNELNKTYTSIVGQAHQELNLESIKRKWGY